MAILALTGLAVKSARTLIAHFPSAHLFIPQRFLLENESDYPHIHGFYESIRQVLQEAFLHHQELVCIMASGIVVRELAPLLNNKHSDPAVLVMDPAGKFVVSLLSGHEGGANRLAKKIAGLTGGLAVITTASDNQNIPALDILAKENGWKLDSRSQLAKVMAALVNDEPVALLADNHLALPTEMDDFPWAKRFYNWHDAKSSAYRKMVVLTSQQISEDFWLSAPDSVVYHPPALVLGMGCNRGACQDEIMDAVRTTLNKNGLAVESVGCLATICDKENEEGILSVCHRMGWELRLFDHEQIQNVKDLPNPSQYPMAALGVWGVAEPAALLAAGALSLLVKKQKFSNVTVAVAIMERVK